MSRVVFVCWIIFAGLASPLAASAQTTPPISIRIWTSTSPHPLAHNEHSVCVGPGYKLIGGGAKVNWLDLVLPNRQRPAGNLLTASFPAGEGDVLALFGSFGDCWMARSKDHDISSPATLTVWAIGLSDPANQWEVVIRKATGAINAHPSASVDLPFALGYALTGGGGRMNWTGPGSLLTASHPSTARWEGRLTGWHVSGKDHLHSEPVNVTAYVIGIRPRNGAPLPETRIWSVMSNLAQHPSAIVTVPAGFQLVGGGAEVVWTGAGNLLTASFPQDNNKWVANSKDHVIASPARITVYAIGIR